MGGSSVPAPSAGTASGRSRSAHRAKWISGHLARDWTARFSACSSSRRRLAAAPGRIGVTTVSSLHCTDTRYSPVSSAYREIALEGKRFVEKDCVLTLGERRRLP